MRRPGNFREKKEFEEKIVQVKRVSTKTKGGNRIGFSVLTVVGDKKGRVGVGLGKAPTVREAIHKGFKRAKKYLVTVPLRGTTIPHRILVKEGAAEVLLKPAPEGTGLKTGGAVRAVVEVAGIRDLVSKILGTRNRASNVYATFSALKKLRPIEETIALRKGRKTREKEEGEGKKKGKEGKKTGKTKKKEEEERKKKEKPAEEKEAVGKKIKKVEEADLSTRTKNALIRAGTKKVDQLKSLSEEEILAVKGLGKKGLAEIQSLFSDQD
jgi:small subunit ribosomal protein S5